MSGEPLSRTGPQSWDPASGIQLPQMPMIPPGDDLMSQTIAAALPTLAAPLEANTAMLQGKETMFSGKVAASNVAYQGSEESGEQGVMQIVQMLGQMAGQAGQMGEMAGAPGQMVGQMGGQFSQLMQPMMQAFQGAGHGGQGQTPGAPGAAGAGGGAAGQGPGGMTGVQQQGRDDDNAVTAPQPQYNADRDDQAMAGPQAGPGETRHGLTPPPVFPHEQPRHDDGGEDLARRV
ncbi:hypothetical protein MFM001_20720 [Mycobacterium sp. MFM001]|uniref:hypothetical protein n=1 Tax=Mycobacterium sp. MFM001 TaxID=2049453 RepID=UPI000DA5BC96|nr:hypothetical protein [Mycobacterium sp. MFM001]GBE65610.1 hypothetical protein MFM001_20720 [Mycobacterium sp. MFM001]